LAAPNKEDKVATTKPDVKYVQIERVQFWADDDGEIHIATDEPEGLGALPPDVLPGPGAAARGEREGRPRLDRGRLRDRLACSVRPREPRPATERRPRLSHIYGGPWCDLRRANPASGLLATV
jgi:hypothetical protein